MIAVLNLDIAKGQTASNKTLPEVVAELRRVTSDRRTSEGTPLASGAATGSADLARRLLMERARSLEDGGIDHQDTTDEEESEALCVLCGAEEADFDCDTGCGEAFCKPCHVAHMECPCWGE